MITKTALTSPRYLSEIKKAVSQAVRNAHAFTLNPGTAIVKNRKGKPSLFVRFQVGGMAQFFEPSGREVTGSVFMALRRWHTGAPAPLAG